MYSNAFDKNPVLFCGVFGCVGATCKRVHTLEYMYIHTLYMYHVDLHRVYMSRVTEESSNVEMIFDIHSCLSE